MTVSIDIASKRKYRPDLDGDPIHHWRAIWLGAVVLAIQMVSTIVELRGDLLSQFRIATALLILVAIVFSARRLYRSATPRFDD